MTARQLPSLVGYDQENAERVAAELGYRVVWKDAPAPPWLSPTHVPRVGRQRLLAAGTLELLRLKVPAIAFDE